MHLMDTGLVPANVARFNIEQLDIRDADNRLLARLETDARWRNPPFTCICARPPRAAARQQPTTTATTTPPPPPPLAS